MSNFVTHTNNTFSGSTTSSIHALEIELFWKPGESWQPNLYTWSTSIWVRTPWSSIRFHGLGKKLPHHRPYSSHQYLQCRSYTFTGHAIEQTYKHLLDEWLPNNKYCDWITGIHGVHPTIYCPGTQGVRKTGSGTRNVPILLPHIGCAIQGSRILWCTHICYWFTDFYTLIPRSQG